MIKSVSSGFGLLRFKLRGTDLAEIEERRRVLARSRYGANMAAYFHHFAHAFDGERSFDSVVVSLPLLREMRKLHVGEWSALIPIYATKPLIINLPNVCKPSLA